MRFEMPDLPMKSVNVDVSEPVKKVAKKRGPSKKVRRQNAQKQTRNTDGTFARIGGFLDRVFAKPKKKRVPILERNFVGKVESVFNGDLARYRSNEARRTSQILQGKKLKTRRRKIR